jgi:hypothetical protein
MLSDQHRQEPCGSTPGLEQLEGRSGVEEATSTGEMSHEKVMAMTELARHHGIKVFLCSLLP